LDKLENWQQREHGQEEIIFRDYFLFWLRSSDKRFSNIKEKGKLFSKRNSLFQDWDSPPKKKEKLFFYDEDHLIKRYPSVKVKEKFLSSQRKNRTNIFLYDWDHLVKDSQKSR